MQHTHTSFMCSWSLSLSGQIVEADCRALAEQCSLKSANEPPSNSAQNLSRAALASGVLLPSLIKKENPNLLLLTWTFRAGKGCCVVMRIHPCMPGPCSLWHTRNCQCMRLQTGLVTGAHLVSHPGERDRIVQRHDEALMRGLVERLVNEAETSLAGSFERQHWAGIYLQDERTSFFLGGTETEVGPWNFQSYNGAVSSDLHKE